MSIQVTEVAGREVQRLLEEKGLQESGGLRLGVKGGGCSGFSYVMRMEGSPRPEDHVFPIESVGSRIFVDPKSYLYLEGIELHFEEDLNKRGFVFRNPNASGSCGCGASFSV